MSQKEARNIKVKKLEQFFGDNQSDNQDDTQLQTTEHPTPTTSQKNISKSQTKDTKIKKIEDQKVKTLKNETIKKLKQLKTPEDEGKTEAPAPVKKQEGIKSIKDNFQDDEEQNIDEKPRVKRNRQKKLQNRYEKMEETEKRANQIIELLDQVYDADIELYKKGKPADKKLKCILEVEKKLKEIELAKSFLNQDGHLLFIEWFVPNPETKQETSLTVKIHVLNLLLDMRLTKENLETANELEKVVKKYKKSRYQVLRDLSSRIVEKWRIVKALGSV